MHFSLLEKLGASALLCAWLIYGANFLGGTLVHVREHESAMQVAGAPEGGATATAPATEVDLGTLLASASPEKGEKVFGKCKACHTIEQGGKNGVGPNLWNVVGGPKAHIEGFVYSDALAARHGETWSYDSLDAFLASPKDYVKGTKMSFAGVKDPQDRADVIAYLRANTTNPPPLPEPAPEATPAAAAAPAAAPAAATPQEPAAASAPAAPPAEFNALLAAADPAVGEKVFNKCKACHSAEKGGKNQVGPNLWNVVGAPIAHHEGFAYSAALAGKSNETWTYDELNTYLTSPKTFAPGTKMTFAGLSKPEERAAVIAFLRTRNDSPPPLP
jgi:cytochrome c